MKYVYILEIGQLSEATNKFEFYDMEVFPSQKAVDHVVKNMIEVNNGYCLELNKSTKGENNTTGFRRGEVETTFITYNCMSAPDFDKEPKSMRVRYVVRKMLVNRNF
jgi:hypothetical protein